MESLYSLIHDFLKNRGIKANDESSGSFSFSVNGISFEIRFNISSIVSP